MPFSVFEHADRADFNCDLRALEARNYQHQFDWN